MNDLLISRFILLFLIWMLPSILYAAQPITIATTHGTITLAKPAQRIIVLEFSLLDDLLQLGVKPIALASSRADEGSNPPFLLSQIKDMAEVGTRQQPNLEKIIALQPDLIVADVTMQGSLYPLLTKIAPTLMLNGLLGDPATQIKNLQILAQATGSQSKVNAPSQRMLTKYLAAKKLGRAHPATVMIGYANNAGQFQALTANALTSKILHDFSHPNLVTILREEQSAPMPLETVLVKNPDSIIFLLTNGNRIPYHAVTKNPLWKELRAVKSKHIYFMDRDIWAKNHGILATELLLKQAEETGFLANQPNLSLKNEE